MRRPPCVLYDPGPEPCAYDPAEWRSDGYPGVDACQEDAEPGSEFCTIHNNQ